MSYRIDDTSITLTRGDTLVAKVDIFDSDGNSYVPVNTDIIRFSLNRRISSSCSGLSDHRAPLITKNIPNETMILRLDSSDTKCMDIGDYVYDISLIKEDGTVDTFITMSDFMLTEEVG